MWECALGILMYLYLYVCPVMSMSMSGGCAIWRRHKRGRGCLKRTGKEECRRVCLSLRSLSIKICILISMKMYF